MPLGPADLLTNYSDLEMEIWMGDTLHAPDRRIRSWPGAAARRERESPTRSRRLAWPTIGFWLGGVLLGTVGCILGICMSSHHPVGVVLSALWWGIYLGCLGASIGGLVGLVTNRNPALPTWEPDDPRKQWDWRPLPQPGGVVRPKSRDGRVVAQRNSDGFEPW
jgi:hypothetical protein